jgi:hypothetical protein
MHKVLGPALLVLLLVVLLNLEASKEPPLPGDGSERELDILCFGQGALLPPIDSPWTNRFKLNDLILAGDKVLRFPADSRGLRVAVFDAAFRLVSHENHDLARSEKAVDDLAESLRAFEDSTIVAMQNRGSIAPPLEESPQRQEKLNRLLLGLGAVSRPHEIPNASWALLCVKLDSRWIKLAEAFSHREGVILSFTLDADLSRYRNFQGEFAFEDMPRDAKISLADSLPDAENPTGAWHHQARILRAGMPANCLSAELARGMERDGRLEAIVKWKKVRLGAEARLECRLGYTQGGKKPYPVYHFVLFVDGKVVERKRMKAVAGWAPAWAPWQVDLSDFSGKTVSLAFKVIQEGGAAPGWGMVGDPVLSWKDDARYAFFAAGHVYGHPKDKDDVIHPPFTERGYLIRQDPDMALGFFTGDIVRRARAEEWDQVDGFLASLPVPVYFAAGNHDMVNRELFERRYGRTYFSFVHDNGLFIVLDPNLDGWNISGEQLAFLKETLRRHWNKDHVFVLTHQILWWDKKPFFRHFTPNSDMGRAEKINFFEELEPLFLALDKPVFFIAGDTGAFPNGKSILYHEKANLRYIASGMGGGDRDNYLVFKVRRDGTVDIQVIALNGNDPHALGRAKDHQVPR